MPYNGTGGWNRLYNWTNDAANGIKIRADRMDAETNDMANNGLGAVLTRDGQGSALADQPMNGFQHTGCAAATAVGQYLVYGQTAAFAAITTAGSLTVAGVAAIHTSLGGWSGGANFEVLAGSAAPGSAISAYQNSAGYAFLARLDSVSAEMMNFNYLGTTTVGSITTDGTSTAYNTSSDARLKDDIEDAPDAGHIIDALRVRSWKWKAGGKVEAFGFVAQEEVLAAPFAVRVGDDDPDTIAKQWGRDDSRLVPLLVKEVQSLRARVATLEHGGS